MRYFLFVVAALILPFSVRAELIRVPEINVWDGTKSVASFVPLKTRGAVGGSVALGDLGKDGISEFVVGSGVGLDPNVGVYRINGTRIGQFLAFPVKVREGVNVAVGDLDADGVNEIVATAGRGGPASVKIFDNNGKPGKVAEFQAFDAAMLSGVNVAVGDLDADGKAEIIVGSGAGPVSEVRIFSRDGVLLSTFQPFGNEDRTGAVVATGDLDADGRDDLIIGQASASSVVKTYRYDNAPVLMSSFRAFGEGFVGGLMIASGDLDGDGNAEIVTTVAGAGRSHVRVYSAFGLMTTQWFAYEESYQGGVAVAVGKVNKNGPKVVTLPKAPVFAPEKPAGRSIEISIGEQRFYAWDSGYLARTFLVSSGLRATPTPLGQFKILRKPLFVNYTRIYGINDARNYSFPNTKYNLMFHPRYYIHTAYWHSNFGRPMSHGCVNTYIDDAEWTYAWADVGTPVTISTSPVTIATLPQENS